MSTGMKVKETRERKLVRACIEQDRAEIARLGAESKELRASVLERERVLDAAIRAWRKRRDESRAEIASLTAELAAYRDAARLYKEASYQSHSGHWDTEGKSGACCPACIRAREAREQGDAALARERIKGMMA